MIYSRLIAHALSLGWEWPQGTFSYLFPGRVHPYGRKVATTPWVWWKLRACL
jgi:hypothetical protein